MFSKSSSPYWLSSFIVIFSILILRVSTRLSTGHVKPFYTKAPKIWLSEYSEEDGFTGNKAEEEFKTENQFQNELITKNESDFILSDIGYVVFTCRAKYPILWKTEIPTQLSLLVPYYIHTISVRRSEFREELNQPVNQYFISRLFLTSIGSNFFSVNFTCSSADNKKYPLRSSIHIFNLGNSILEKQGETIIIPISIENDDEHHTAKSVILPCRPAHPQARVTLEKLFLTRHGESIWKQVPSELLKFDPKVGFSMDKFSRGKKLFGSYRCIVNNSDVSREDSGVVYINVTKAASLEEELPLKFQPHITTKGKGSVTLNTSSWAPEIICCSGESSNAPTMLSESCEGAESGLQCEALKAGMLIKIKEYKIRQYYSSAGFEDPSMSKDCRKQNLFGSTSIVYCHANSVDFLSEYVPIFKSDAGIVKARPQADDIPSYPIYLTEFKNTVDARKARLTERILILVGYYSNSGKEDHKGNFRRTVFYESDYANSETLFSDASSLDTIQLVPEIQELTVEYERNFYYDEEPLYLMCFGLKYFHSYGAQMRINWKNGTRQIIEFKKRDQADPIQIILYGNTDFIRTGDLVSVFGKNVTASLEMVSVDCFMPFWNSSKWDKLTYNLSILESILPSFEGAENEEIIYLALNDTQKEIKFEVSGGLPRPTAHVTKDGKEISAESQPSFENNIDEYEQNSTVNIITIKFTEVTHEVQGVFKCVIENPKGKVTKTIKVFITEKGGVDVVTIVSITITVAFGIFIVLLLLVFGIKCCQLKRMLQNNQEIRRNRL